MDIAKEVKSEFESASVTYNIYVVRDKKIGVYKFPQFRLEEKADYRTQLIRACLGGQLKADQADGAEIYFLGTYEDKSGTFSLLDHPEFLVDLSDYIER